MPPPEPARNVQVKNAQRRRGVSETQPPVYYEITVEGVLEPRWSAWFDGMQLASDAGRTTIAGPVVDQAALHGLLAKVRDLGLPLLAVHRAEPP